MSVIGAGPCGLTVLALLLRAGVEAHGLDGGSAVRTGGRATGLTPSSIAVLDRIGLAEEVLDRAVPVLGLVRHRLGAAAETFAFDLGPGPRPRNVSLDQDELCGLLIDFLERDGGLVDWKHRLQALRPDGDAWTATLETPSGAMVRTFATIAVCDGASSTTRRELGLELVGGTEMIASFSCTVRLAAGALEGDRMHQFLQPGRRIVLVPLRGEGRFRVTGSVDLEDADGPVGGAIVERYIWERTGLRSRVDATSGADVRVYRIRWGLASGYGKGTATLLGDAAHAFPPDGAFGLNRAIEDGARYADLVTCGASAREHLESQRHRREVDRELLNRSLALRRVTLDPSHATAQTQMQPGGT